MARANKKKNISNEAKQHVIHQCYIRHRKHRKNDDERESLVEPFKLKSGWSGDAVVKQR
jgi:hypothetical protein